jgi:membrane protease YdiL (CAAX protease family)
MQEIENPRRKRLSALLMVLFFAFALPLSNSIYLFFSSSSGVAASGPPNKQSAALNFFIGTVFELLSLAFLIFVLAKQGRRLKGIGLSFSWKDIPESILLALAGYGAALVVTLGITYGSYLIVGRPVNTEPRNVEFMGAGISVAMIVFLLINPFYEELIVRAYLMTEAHFLLGERDAAVLISTIFQTSYHLYQGLPPALSLGAMFLVFSIYFAWRGRALPVILAHLYMDFIALFMFPR